VAARQPERARGERPARGTVTRGERSADGITATVIIAARNAGDTLGTQLAALSRQDFTGTWETIVVDNGSSDATAQVALEWAGRVPALRVVSAPERRGIPHARNTGARAAVGSYLLFCDADDEVAPGWVTGLVRGLKEYPMVGGRLKPHPQNSPGDGRRVLNENGLSIALGWKPWAVGCNWGIRRDVFVALGGLDLAYGSCEDIEFSWRALQRGLDLGFAPDGVVLYRHRDGVWANVRQAYKYAVWFPCLFRDFRSQGMPQRGLRSGARDWVRLIRQTPALRRKDQRVRWAREAAQCVGRAVGSLRFRAVWL
jgi:glycosyltransferase involved in cell wall biosynthesis